MSHELRTPLNGTLGIARLSLAKGDVGEELKRSLETIERSGATLRKLIDDLLDMSRIEAGQLTSNREVFSIAGLLNDVTSLVRPLAAEHGTGIEVVIDDSVPSHVEGDLAHLRQVLLNLLGNAVKFTRKGSISVAVFAGDENMEGLNLRFAISDTGLGIPADEIDRIFEPLTRASNTIEGRYGGTGLGLAIANRLVKAMGGNISVHSKLHEGSTFTFNVVVRRAPAVGDAVGESDPKSSTARLRLLLVEDDPVNQQVAAGFLELEGHEVTVAQTGEEAITIARQQKFDAILMDMRLPDMTGLAATKAIRADQSIPVVALTANIMPEDTKRYLGAGIVAVVAKPIDPGKLNSALGRIAQRRRTGVPHVPVHIPAAFDAEEFGVLFSSFPLSRTAGLLQELECSIAESVEVIEAALARGCHDAVARRAHRLAGTAAGFALKNLQAASADLEAAASNGDDAARISQVASHALSEARRALAAVAVLSDSIRKASSKAAD
jgi:CheY-like chemotaxis protein/HPt (histidine-containing phosphotransfer) domain-containing protein